MPWLSMPGGYGEPVTSFVDESQIRQYSSDGVVCLRGVFTDWIDVLADGVARNESEPGPYFAENVPDSEPGRFWDDYCNWQRIGEFEDFAFHSPAGEIAGELMQSNGVQLFHDHVLVKGSATPTPTPWHSDGPYYFVGGQQTLSFWIPLDPVDSLTLRMIPGSHRWAKDVLPVRWMSGDDFYVDVDDYLPIPDPDAEPDRFDVAEWAMEPGDALAFHFRTVHGARGNPTADRRRAFALRLVGDDARYITRPGPTSPPFPGHGMSDGDKLRSDWFPFLAGAPG